MDSTGIKEIAAMSDAAKIVMVDGVPYSASQLKRVFDNREIASIKLNTLTGLVDYIKSGIDPVSLKNSILVIDSPKKVSLVSALDETTKRREVFAIVELDEIEKFPFGQFIEAESFNIKLASLFVDVVSRSTVLQYVSKLTVNNSIEVADDGVSQSAIIKKGMSGAIKENTPSPTLVELAPYRTFLDVEQPLSQFLFRMRANGNVPSCTFFEADGGAWRGKAMKNIKEYLESNTTLKVLA